MVDLRIPGDIVNAGILGDTVGIAAGQVNRLGPLVVGPVVVAPDPGHIVVVQRHGEAIAGSHFHNAGERGLLILHACIIGIGVAGQLIAILVHRVAVY